MPESSGSKSWLIAVIVGVGFLVMLAVAAFIFWSSFTGEKVHRSVMMLDGGGEVILSWRRVPPYNGPVEVIVTAVDGTGIKLFRETIARSANFSDFSRDYSRLSATDSGVAIGTRFLLVGDAATGRLELGGE